MKLREPLVARARARWSKVATHLPATRRDYAAIREQAGYAFSLQAMFAGTEGLLPPLGGGALDARRCHGLVHAVASQRPSYVMEFGPGVSTFLCGITLRRLGIQARIVTFEHDQGWAERIQQYDSMLGVPGLDLRLAPLEEDGHGVRWYARQMLPDDLSDIDFLIVDGPPNVQQDGSRFPALEVIRQMRHGTVYVDDTDRADERLLVELALKVAGVRLLFDGGNYVLLALDSC